MSDLTADLVVLGSGPGGYTAAFRAADLGKKVILIERFDNIGGVCLNVGCIPSKALLHAAKVIDDAEQMSAHGIKFGAPEIDVSQLKKWKESTVKKLTGGLKMLSKQRKVDIINGFGKFTSPTEITVDSSGKKQTIGFKNAIIAVGSKPVKLPFLPDDPRIFDSTGALELDHTEGDMLIIGGGIIGLEMATVYHRLGANITVVEMMDGIVAGADKDVVKPLHTRLKKQFKDILLETKVTKVEAKKDGLWVTFEGKAAPEKPQRFDMILSAVGRTPNGKTIDAEKAGVKVDDRGFINVDKQLRTNVDHIFAIGDVVGNPMLAHKAVAEGRVAAEVIAGMKHYFDVKTIPSVAYTDPEIAWTGVTESEAKEKGIHYGTGTFPWMASGRALTNGREEGLTKVIFDEDSGQVIGAGIVGVNAGELISELTLAIEMGCDAEDIALTVHPHPTLSESVAMATEMYEGTITDLIAPKKKK